MRTPDDAHSGSAARLHAGNAVFKHETLFRFDFGFCSVRADLRVDGLEGDEVYVRVRFSSAGGDPWVVAEDAVRKGEIGE